MPQYLQNTQTEKRKFDRQALHSPSSTSHMKNNAKNDWLKIHE